ncbi:MAG: hypothetical protein BWY66_02557 [bacterium ADurb.Bin374]|nr:MAG: hypothetical protein BWY66_02557 [bacterium ADurb.Bin374]
MRLENVRDLEAALDLRKLEELGNFDAGLPQRVLEASDLSLDSVCRDGCRGNVIELKVLQAVRTTQRIPR